MEQIDGEGWVEYAVYGAPGELPAFPDGEAEVAGVRVAVRGDEVADDWAERWKRFHQPSLVGGAGLGAPAVVAAADRDHRRGRRSRTGLRHRLSRDHPALPGAAAGPGAEGSLADLGCGSGVLAIVAAKLGFGPIIAVDHDPAALAATRENARANGVVLRAVERHDLRRTPPPQAQTVVANLMRPLLLCVADLMEPRPRALILSGLLEDEAEEVAAAFAPLRERRRLSSLGWSALLLAHP